MRLSVSELIRPDWPWATVLCGRSGAEDQFFTLADSLTAIELRDLGFRAVQLRGKRCTTRERLFQEVGAAFQFPYYYGHNWMAFDECIQDLDEWMPAIGYLVVVSDLSKVLPEDDEGFRFFVNTMSIAAHAWGSGRGEETNFPRDPVVFKVFFHTIADDLTLTMERLRRCGSETLEVVELAQR